jgi:Asp-tRNA(Asn)/Glu-tRNA(Gln) amidotransferase A subunit family amidase
MTELADYIALEARDGMARGEFSATELCESCLRRIAAREAEIGAFAYFEDAQVRRAAKAADDYRNTGRPLGALHGLPIGVKDIIDTADMPTENGTSIDAGRRPSKDAEVVRRLRQAGAIIMGKTVTTELAFFAPGKTRNPHDPAHTPGGSSSGSAAAVAAGFVPLAIGSQTFGSVIRPASFCGVVGFKPSFGLISRAGVRLLAAPLDTVGVFARTVTDAALLADALAGRDPADPDTKIVPPPRLLEAALTAPPVTPELAFVKTPAWDEAEHSTQESFVDLAKALGRNCAEVPLPDVFGEWMDAQRTLMRAGMAHNLEAYYRKGRDRLSQPLRSLLEEGRQITAVDYLAALDRRASLSNTLEQLFDRYDAVITPAAPGEAPAGLGSTGNPAFNGLWTLCGVPAVSLPLLRGPKGLPVGVQLVGRHGEDARLLRTAQWLIQAVENAQLQK